MSNVNVMAISIQGNEGCHGHHGNHHIGRPQHGHHHHQNRECGHEEGGQEAAPPSRNKFLDFLTAPMKALKGGGNNNDRQYDKYLAASQGGNLLKGF